MTASDLINKLNQLKIEYELYYIGEKKITFVLGSLSKFIKVDLENKTVITVWYGNITKSFNYEKNMELLEFLKIELNLLNHVGAINFDELTY